jgi:hypothetical protein
LILGTSSVQIPTWIGIRADYAEPLGFIFQCLWIAPFNPDTIDASGHSGLARLAHYLGYLRNTERLHPFLSIRRAPNVFRRLPAVGAIYVDQFGIKIKKRTSAIIPDYLAIPNKVFDVVARIFSLCLRKSLALLLGTTHKFYIFKALVACRVKIAGVFLLDFSVRTLRLLVLGSFVHPMCVH